MLIKASPLNASGVMPEIYTYLVNTSMIKFVTYYTNPVRPDERETAIITLEDDSEWLVPRALFAGNGKHAKG
jgi:hypothetical protein